MVRVLLIDKDPVTDIEYDEHGREQQPEINTSFGLSSTVELQTVDSHGKLNIKFQNFNPE